MFSFALFIFALSKYRGMLKLGIDFEEVQEDLEHSPDSREVADYDEYCRRELPRHFRAALEEIVHTES
jgi:hypothetical protein